ncbi:hypothetical protein [Jannaschia sp. LMIT008]|uniref:hypothetical protein n=1 Tax=Jannaschia maritima TaxID=3032585 RepID=UPI00281199CC|nr:hypothetical protein [Jannaschia sp. LMIT008]
MIIVNFLIGVLTGLLVPRAERWLKGWAESIWLGGLPLEEHEFDLAALLVILMAAAIVVAVLGAPSNAFMLAFGALLGLFGKRIWARVKDAA